jgi:phage terminase large subunit
MFQVSSSEYRMINYIEGNLKTWDVYSKELKDLEYVWGRMWLPHDGYAKRIESKGLSSADILRGLGWDVPDVEDIKILGVEEGIKLTRMKFNQLYIDKDNCADFIEHIKRYRRNINQKTGTAGTPLHDDHSHAADMIRYFAVNSEKMTNTDMSKHVDVSPDPMFYYG